jgi:hypothetical protein
MGELERIASSAILGNSGALAHQSFAVFVVEIPLQNVPALAGMFCCHSPHL